MLRPVYDATDGLDGRVSIEVDPRLAHDTAATIAEAKQLAWLVDRPNMFIKIPATKPGLPAITETIAEGISVNVTLIFSLERYREVMDAYLTGLEKAKATARTCPGSTRWPRSSCPAWTPRSTSAWTRSAPTRPRRCKGKAGVANARLAYQAYEEVFATDRWAGAGRAGATAQRPLWASTGVKDPAYKDTLYVDELVAPDTVNTMPEATLDATADHGEITRRHHPRQLRGGQRKVLDALDEARHLLRRSRRSCSRTRAWRSSSVAGSSCWRPSRPPWTKRRGLGRHELAGLRSIGSGAGRCPPAHATPCRGQGRVPDCDQDETLWGPEAEAEAAIRLGWVEPRRSPAAAGGDSCAAQATCCRRRDPVRAGRYGRLLTGSRSHRQYRRGGTDRARHARIRSR